MSPVSKALISLGAFSMVLSPVVASASGSTLPGQTSRPVGAYLPDTAHGIRSGTVLTILGIATAILVLGFSMKGHKRSR